MLFSTPVFLFGFLPIVLLLYGLMPKRFSNTVLLSASLLFYAYGAKEVVLAMLGSITVNWLLGLSIANHLGTARARLGVALAVSFNLGMLVYFKYTNFLVENVNALAESLGAEPWDVAYVLLPIGISFFSFQAMSYVIDVARGDAPPQRNPVDFALYIALFPQLIAGPIVRYADIARQLGERRVTAPGFAEGVRRFLIGLGKKMLLANTVAQVSDELFALPASSLSTSLAWLAVLCYSLQIYFDFSGYSDMAIGLGHMFGFRFLENFNYPYIARSITEFWRRWHMSLSSWFRDYLYIPLGGNRGSRGATLRNLMLVFLLCGLWHGASWSFVVWGLFHGSFLVIERVALSAQLARLPRALRHVYTLLVVMVGWTFFRAETLEQALTLLGAMAGFARAPDPSLSVALSTDALLLWTLGAAILGCVPWLPRVRTWLAQPTSRNGAPSAGLRAALATGGTLALLVVFLGCAMFMAAGTHNPFIYFRF
ncbi:MAG: alginate O-acetyltransferase [Planctomycetota bacterium]|nr:MAG: alginate O-acetyltransferase [Planctomycetota bacterium]